MRIQRIRLKEEKKAKQTKFKREQETEVEKDIRKKQDAERKKK